MTTQTEPSNSSDRTGGQSADLAAGEALTRMRAAAPLVHCITNYVAMNIAANVVLAAGASPAMVHAEEEAADFTAMVGALTVNIGTTSGPWHRAMVQAARAARSGGTPWILDPVAHFITPFRRNAAAELMALSPTIVRGNASEILALAGAETAGKGADAGDAVEHAAEPARALATQTGSVVVVTGVTDIVTDGARMARISGGHALMPKVTALGCALTALTGAYAAVETDPFGATVAACAHFAAAGARAGADAAGPGSFQVAFLDALADVGPADLDAWVASA
ncbi:MAG: hydroxyethylthiazole kinase [Pseudomonadota bacterium]